MNIPLLNHRPLPAEDLSSLTPVVLDLPVILGESRYQSAPFMTILDEYGYYLSPGLAQALSACARVGRKHSAGPIMATQNLTDFLFNPFKSIGLSPPGQPTNSDDP